MSVKSLPLRHWCCGLSEIVCSGLTGYCEEVRKTRPIIDCSGLNICSQADVAGRSLELLQQVGVHQALHAHPPDTFSR
jgi:hypothetical protein